MNTFTVNKTKKLIIDVSDLNVSMFFLPELSLCPPYSRSLTFHVADFIFTVLPRLVRVHFIRRKKLRSVICSLPFFDGPKVNIN